MSAVRRDGTVNLTPAIETLVVGLGSGRVGGLSRARSLRDRRRPQATKLTVLTSLEFGRDGRVLATHGV